MKYVIRTTTSTLPISEEELPKVVMAMDKKAIVVLRAGIVNGAFIAEIVRDIHGEKGFNYGYKFVGEDGINRSSYVTDLPELMKEHKNQLEIGIKLLD